MQRGEKIKADFENKIRKIISENIIRNDNDFVVFENKDVTDIIICRNVNTPKIFFVEIKHYSDTNGRIGFGDRYGNGFQPEILTKRPRYFEENMRWVFGQDDYYYILTNNDCLKYITGKNIGEKQNNFQYKLFTEMKKYDTREFIEYFRGWLNT